jgi:pSer/pThr/pTyr-binding forkhead associated (FHA) protein
MVSLRVDDGQHHVLARDVVSIGRDRLNDVVLSGDPKVSRTHAELRHQDDQWVLVDLGSRNGTVVNDRRITRHPLKDGDRIRVGTTSFTMEIGGDVHATEVATELAMAPQLSDRERQILGLVAIGRTDKAIAEELGISISTVRSHLDRTREKTGLRRRSELTRLAIDLRIVG